MILPIVAYGHPVLKKKAENVTLDKERLSALIVDMFDTMNFAKGVGLAAPQIGLSERVFIIDSSKMSDDDDRKSKSEKPIKEVFINAHIVEESGEMVSYEEGCLSIPNVYGNVDRPANVKINYFNEKFVQLEKEFTGFTARIIQHEYDHIEGLLFVEKLKPIKKQMIRRKLDDIKKGQIHSKYKMKFANK